MAVEGVIIYNYKTIENISSTFNAVLDEDIINNLLEIKKNNKFIRRRSPIRLKYKISVANTWRNERESHNLSDTDKIVNSLISNLNKISDKNYNLILDDIESSYILNIENPSMLRLITQTICEKAMIEKIYCNLYAKLLADLYSKNKSDIIKYTQDICDEFFKTRIEFSLNSIGDNSDDYDTICKIIKDKTEFTGGFIFIANLFKYEIIEYDLVKRYYDSLVNYINICPKEQIGRYIDAIISIIENCGKYLQNHNKELFNDNFMKIVYDLIADKKKIIPKYRFKLMDITEKYQNNWIETDNEGWQQV